MAAKDFHCTTCGLTGAWSCLPNTWYTDDGTPVEAIPYDGLSGDRCPECGVRKDGYHHLGCSLEEIPDEMAPKDALIPDPNAPHDDRPATAIAVPQGILAGDYSALFAVGYLAGWLLNHRVLTVVMALVIASLFCRLAN